MYLQLRGNFITAMMHWSTPVWMNLNTSFCKSLCVSQWHRMDLLLPASVAFITTCMHMEPWFSSRCGWWEGCFGVSSLIERVVLAAATHFELGVETVFDLSTFHYDLVKKYMWLAINSPWLNWSQFPASERLKAVRHQCTPHPVAGPDWIVAVQKRKNSRLCDWTHLCSNFFHASPKDLSNMWY